MGDGKMKHPTKWRETIDPFELPYKNFVLEEVLGYPHAGNDVFHVRGRYQQKTVEAFVKVARQRGADIKREVETITKLEWPNIPEIIDHDEKKERFVVSLAKEGERLSAILGHNADMASLEYMYEYGQTLAVLHSVCGYFPDVKDRTYFHMPTPERLQKQNLNFVYEYLTGQQPMEVNRCFCHGDFHYANILWKDKHISAILDFELSGIGNKEFDIAWALILRPGQQFLKSREEIGLFLDGYFSKGSCNLGYVKYYMVLIYTYFFEFGADTPGYQDYVRNFFYAIVKGR